MRRWSTLSQVDRVDLYTRQSLYVLLWATSAFIVLRGLDDGREHHVQYTVAAGGAVLVTLAATPVLREISTLYPATGPLPWRVLTPYLLLAASYVGVGLGMPDPARAVVVMVTFATLAWSLGGLRANGPTVALVMVLAALPAVSSGRPWWALGGLAVAAFFLFTVRVSLWLLMVVTELDRARGAQAALAVAEERLRFSRDVHDVLGRRLSTIAVHAELAATLAARGDDGVAGRMLEVRGVAHEALREARELARGYRATDLARELEGARSLLRSAGIAVDLDVDGLPERWHEPAAWVVREAVTNVLRHSTASRVAIRYADRQLSVTNDGPTSPDRPGSDGAGLAGLRERLEPLGADVATRRSEAEFVLMATLPPTRREVLA